jgi:hypothetical protein
MEADSVYWNWEMLPISRKETHSHRSRVCRREGGADGRDSHARAIAETSGKQHYSWRESRLSLFQQMWILQTNYDS